MFKWSMSERKVEEPNEKCQLPIIRNTADAKTSVKQILPEITLHGWLSTDKPRKRRKNPLVGDRQEVSSTNFEDRKLPSTIQLLSSIQEWA